MNVKRFVARTAREALVMVREALGEDAVVLSTKPCAEGVAVTAMAPEGLQQAEAAGAQATVVRAPQLMAAAAHTPAPAVNSSRPMTLAERIAARGEHRLDARRAAPRAEPQRHEPSLDDSRPLQQRLTAAAVADAMDPAVAQDVQTLGMSTLTFQDYVRERMLRRRQAELAQQEPSVADALRPAPAPRRPEPPRLTEQLREPAPEQRSPRLADRLPSRAAVPAADRGVELRDAAFSGAPVRNAALRQLAAQRSPAPVLHDEIRLAGPRLADPALLDDEPRTPPPVRRAAAAPSSVNSSAASAAGTEVMGELREVRNLIEERFGMLAFMERMQRDPRQVALLQKLFDAGLSPGLVRKLAQALPADVPDELAWAATVLERNLVVADSSEALEDHPGVLALIGPTGVGKTTTTAKIAAAFATRHGAANLGLITLDAYRVAAHEQLRTYGRILGVPVHTAHDRASLEDLLELLSAKKLVLIDTAGVAQRDSRTRELLEMLSHRAIQKVLVLNAAAQGETVEDVMAGYGVASCRGVILSKLDEAVKLAPAVDTLIRHRAKVLGVANGQRVPEDWHHLSAQALVQRALRGGGTATWRLDANEVNLVFAGTQGTVLAASPARPADLHA
ncbi:MAG: flagellar biosynthesis protein FlhF [Burkholderiales bacterium PBB5]|nr:MAG: flagellar biosynthesis protein FlhF [Burkholderiales bacterium PBB5]